MSLNMPTGKNILVVDDGATNRESLALLLDISAVGEVAERPDLLDDVGFLQKPIDVDRFNGAIHRFTSPYRPTVLAVEDDARVRTMLDLALRHHGFNVRLAANGKEAVERYRQHYRYTDVALLDVQMPGLDGPATLTALKEIYPLVRCCFMSGHTGKYSTEELLGLGAYHVFPKPFVSLSLLAQTLWDVATLPAAQEQHRAECPLGS